MDFFKYGEPIKALLAKSVAVHFVLGLGRSSSF
jgi:hypothetical protein